MLELTVDYELGLPYFANVFYLAFILLTYS